MHIQTCNRIPDGFIWRRSSPQCRKARAIKAETAFEASIYDLKDCLMIYAAWNANFSINHMRALYGLESVKGIRNLCRRFRTMAWQWYENNLIEFPLGSTGGIGSAL